MNACLRTQPPDWPSRPGYYPAALSICNRPPAAACTGMSVPEPTRYPCRFEEVRMPFERTAVLLLSLLAACSQPTGSYEGRIVDPWTGSGRGGVKVIARGPNDVRDAACQVTEGTTSSDGTFRLERTCADVTYSLRLDDPKLVAPDLPVVKGGGAEKAATDIAAWRIPGSAGVYLLRKDQLESLHMNAAVEGAWIKGTDKKEVALYPTAVPDPVPTIQPGDVLILAGAATISRLK